MNKTIYILMMAIFGFILATKTGFFNAAFMFILVGVIPGTEIVIPANAMLLMISTVACAALVYPTARNLLPLILNRRDSHEKAAVGTHLPKQRFKKIEA